MITIIMCTMHRTQPAQSMFYKCQQLLLYKLIYKQKFSGFFLKTNSSQYRVHYSSSYYLILWCRHLQYQCLKMYVPSILINLLTMNIFSCTFLNRYCAHKLSSLFFSRKKISTMVKTDGHAHYAEGSDSPLLCVYRHSLGVCFVGSLLQRVT